MDRELRERWVTALRSGEYAQAHFSLHNELGFCCLGVLQAIDKNAPSCSQPVDDFYTYADELLKEFGGSRYFWQLNDSQRLSFPQIADYIERKL